MTINRKQALAAALLVAPLVSQSASGLELRCNGTQYVFEKGFGAKLPLQMETVRLVKVDFSKKSIVADTLYGERVAAVEYSERFIEATLEHGRDHFGTVIYGERVSINRSTGEMLSIYKLSTDRGGKGFMAFVGECVPGPRTKF